MYSSEEKILSRLDRIEQNLYLKSPSARFNRRRNVTTIPLAPPLVQEEMHSASTTPPSPRSPASRSPRQTTIEESMKNMVVNPINLIFCGVCGNHCNYAGICFSCKEAPPCTNCKKVSTYHGVCIQCQADQDKQEGPLCTICHVNRTYHGTCMYCDGEYVDTFIKMKSVFSARAPYPLD